KPKRKDTQVPQPSGPTDIIADEAVYKELGDSLVRVATTASSLEVEQDSGGGPKHQETIGDTISQTGFKNVSKLSNDLLLVRVLDLEKTKTTQAEEIVSLKRRVKKLEQKKRSRSHGLKRLHKVGMSRRVESSGDEDSLEQEVVAKDVNLTIDEVTLAQALAALKNKGKGIMVEEPVKTMKKKDLIRLDEETAKRLQAEFDEEERLTREKDEANVALIEEKDDI
ncbi:hypothetical protein Tco_0965008, partial [Tanacetum coccineum]